VNRDALRAYQQGGNRANRSSTPWGCAISLIRIVIVLSVILLFPVFMLPMMLARFALVGRKGLRLADLTPVE